MGKQHSQSRIRARLAGKWQVPTFLVSVFLLAVALWSRPEPVALVPLTADEALARLTEIAKSGQSDKAIRFGEALLREKDSFAAIAPAVHLQLARCEFDQAAARSPGPRDGRRVEGRYRLALESGQSIDAEDYRRLALAAEWREEFVTAAELYEQAVEAGVPNHSQVLRRLYDIHKQKLKNPAVVLSRVLDKFLSQTGEASPDDVLWAMEQKLAALDELGDLSAAGALIERHADRFAAPPHSLHLDYYRALLRYRSGDGDGAEASLRELRDRVETWDDLHAMSGWLLGRILLGDDEPERPLEALSFFDDVLAYHSQGPYAVACRIGRAEALAILERHDEAVLAFTEAVDDAAPGAYVDGVGPEVLRITLGVLADGQRAVGRFQSALGYARTAATLADSGNSDQLASLLQQLVSAQTLRAQEIDSTSKQEGHPPGKSTMPKESMALFAEAAENCLRIAALGDRPVGRAAEARWRAAELFLFADDKNRSADLFAEFAIDYPSDARVPRALLSSGKLRLSAGRIPEAIDILQECRRRFPQTLEGSRSLIPLAQAFLDAPGGDVALAEHALSLVLDESDVFTPIAPEFADAMFLRGEALHRRGAYESAIAVLEEAIERFPSDSRLAFAQFRLGDCYRRSAKLLRDQLTEAPSSTEADSIRSESTKRLQHAKASFHAASLAKVDQGAEMTGSDARVVKRLAELYEADCLFDMRDYRGALTVYEAILAGGSGDARSLSAYVQIVNCFVFLGEWREAKEAVRRGAALADAIMPQECRPPKSSRTREGWIEYFSQLERSGFLDG